MKTLRLRMIVMSIMLLGFVSMAQAVDYIVPAGSNLNSWLNGPGVITGLGGSSVALINNVSTDPDTLTNVETITSLTTNGTFDSELQAFLNKLTGLQTLDCSASTSLTALNLNNNKALVSLNLSNCNIKPSLVLDGFPSLTDIDVSNNQNLSSLTLSNNPKLEALTLDANNKVLKTIIIDKVGASSTDGLQSPFYPNSVENLTITNSKLYTDRNTFTSFSIINSNLKNITITGNSTNGDYGLEIDGNESLVSSVISNNSGFDFIQCSNSKKLTNLKITDNVGTPTPTYMLISVFNNDILETATIEDNKSFFEILCMNNEKLSSLSVKNNADVRVITCSYNMLSSLDVSFLPLLKYISCENQKTGTLNITMTPEQYNNFDWSNTIYSLTQGDDGFSSPYSPHARGDGALKNITKFVDVNNGKILATAADFITAVGKGFYSNDDATKFSIISSDVEVFSDPELKRWVKNHKKAFEREGVKVASDGTIVPTESNIAALAAMKTLEITDTYDMLIIDTNEGPTAQHYYNIYIIDDLLKYMPGLVTLNCSGNKLISLDISNNENLEELICSFNKIHYVDISKTKIVSKFMAEDNGNPFTLVLKHSQDKFIGDFINNTFVYPYWTKKVFTDEEDVIEGANPVVQYSVFISKVDGVTTTKAMGLTHYVQKGYNFTFDYYVKAGYDGSKISVTTDFEPYNKYITVVPLGDGGYRVKIYGITRSINVTLSGVQLVSSVGSEAISDNAVWAAGSVLYVRSTDASDLKLYNMSGVLCKSTPISSGTSSFVLQRGIYIVILGDKLTQKVIIR